MFFDRHAAGAQLAQKLQKFTNQNAIVYALPRGGVPVGYQVARKLNLPLDVVLVQKIGHPMKPDYGICSVTEKGDRVCDECGLCGLDEHWLNYEIYLQQVEAARRRQLYTGGHPSISAEDKLAILVDDGMATGISMKAAIKSIQAEWPEKIIVATPVAPHEVVLELHELVDDVIVVYHDRQFRGTVAAYYNDFTPVTDHEVAAFLALAREQQLQPVGNRTTAVRTLLPV
jgi:putative phosphoribosyl transferase